jgi:hypothetical protein
MCHRSRSHRYLVTVAVGLLVCRFPLFAADPPTTTDESAQLLQRHKITPDTAGISAYLRGLQPSKGEQQRIAALIVRLDGKNFADREAASRKLVQLGKRARPALQQAAKTGSIEVKQRAKSILAIKDKRTEQLMSAVFVTIEKRRPTGVIELLIKTVPLCDREHLRLSLVRALSASARPRDEEALTATLKNGTPEQQGAAVFALESVLGAKSIELLRRTSKDATGFVQLCATEALAKHAPRQCLPVLVELLNSDEPRVRIRSGLMLRKLTGKRFGFIGGSDDSKIRAVGVKKWREWVSASGTTATLNTP